MITGEVIRRAALIGAAMLVAVGALDWIAEHTSGRRGVRFVADFVVLSAFALGLEYLLGGSAAVVETLTH